MAAYATIEEFRALAHEAVPYAEEAGESEEDEPVETPESAEASALYASLLERASRIFDLATEREPNYFAKAEDEASEREFVALGEQQLSLPPYVAGSLAEVNLPEGYGTLGYYEAGGYLVRASGGLTFNLMNFPLRRHVPVWPLGVTITIKARWGFAETPAEVTQAVLEIAIKLLRESDPATMKTVELEAQASPALPPTAELIAEKWRQKRAGVFA